MYKLYVKLDDFKPEISRTIYVPENIKFFNLDSILRHSFALGYAHISLFYFDGLQTPIGDLERLSGYRRAVDMSETYISDYINLFRKFSWVFDLNKTYKFTVKIRKPEAKYDSDWPFIESFECDYNPIEGCFPEDFKIMLNCTLNDEKIPEYILDFPMEKFDLDKTNEKLKEVLK